MNENKELIPQKTWILIPVAYFGKIWGTDKFDIMSNGVFMKNGTSYPFTKLSKDERIGLSDLICQHCIVYTDAHGIQHFNETMYEEVGLAYSGAQYTWEIFMVSHSSYI